MRLSSGREKSQKPLNHRRWRLGMSRKSLFFSFLSGSVLFGSISGVNWGMTHTRHYTRQYLTPEMTRLLTETLDRPVQLGSIEQTSLTHIRIGSSVVPATATDRDTVTVEAIDIQFNPIAALWQRRIHLTITLVKPTAFFDQDDAGNWSTLTLDLDGEDLVEVKQIRLQDATIVLAPRAKTLRSLVNNPEAQGIPVAPPQVTLQQVNLSLNLADPGQPLKFNLAGQAETGGNFRVQGEATPEAKKASLRLETNQFNVTSLNPLLPPTARLDQGQLSSRLSIKIDPDEPIDLRGRANLKDLSVQVEGEPNLFTRTTGQFRFRGQEITVSDAQTAYGQIPFDAVQGTIHLQEGLNLQGKVQSVSIPAFLGTFDLAVPFATKGLLQTTDLRATGPIDGAIFSGTVHDVEPVQLDRVDIAAVEGDFTYDTGSDRLELHKVNLTPKAGGIIASRGLAILGEEDKGEPDDLMLDLEVKDLPGDAIAQLYGVTMPGMHLGGVNAKANVAVLNEQPDLQVQWRLDQATYPAQGQVILADDKLRLQNTQIQVADQRIQVAGELADDRWQLLADATELPLTAFFPNLPGQITGAIQLEGTVDQPLDSTQGTIQAQLQTSDGSARADATLYQGQWQAQLQSQGMALAGFAADLPGALTGTVDLTGSLANLDASAIQAKGQIRLSEGISRQNAFFNQPLTASFAWQGDRLNIYQAQMAGLNLSGWLATQFDNWQNPAITGLNLDVQLQDYDLAAMPFPLPRPIAVQGKAAFQGRVQGTPTAPNLNGNLQLHNFAVNQLAFASLLSGHVKFAAHQGLNLNLLGRSVQHQSDQPDQITLKLDDRHRLNALTVRLGEAVVQATTQSETPSRLHRTPADRLLATVQNFPLEKLNFSPGEAWGTVGGLLSGRFLMVLDAQPTVAGEVSIDRPSLGMINAAPHPNHANDRFVGKIQYHDRNLSLTEGQLRLGAGQYHLSGSLNSAERPASDQSLSDQSLQDQPLQLTGQLTTDSGNLQDLATLMPDAAWQTVWHRLGIPQLSSLFPVSQSLVAAASEASQPELQPEPPAIDALPNPASLQLPLPSLTSLQGQFTTQINLRHSPDAGLAVDFNLQGQDWHWGEYGIKQITIGNSRFEGKQLTLSPVHLQGLVYTPANQAMQTFDTAVTFTGQMGDRQTGQFRAEAIPVALLGRFFNLPIPLAGNLQATATLDGSMASPVVRGTLETTGIRLNARQIKDLQVMFRYNNNQFQVEDWQLMQQR